MNPRKQELQVVIDRVRADCVARLRSAQMDPAADRVEAASVVWSGRLRTTAGFARLRRNRVELSWSLLADHPERVEATLRHEFAHIADGINHHGASWVEIDLLLGGTGKRCHNYEVRRPAPVPVVMARCLACSAKIPLTNRGLKKIGFLIHKPCRSRLALSLTEADLQVINEAKERLKLQRRLEKLRRKLPKGDVS